MKFEVMIRAKVDTYGKVIIDAKDEAEAKNIAAAIALLGWRSPELPAATDFEPELETMTGFEVDSVLPVAEWTQDLSIGAVAPEAA
jgi:hypothetical protein